MSSARSMVAWSVGSITERLDIVKRKMKTPHFFIFQNPIVRTQVAVMIIFACVLLAVTVVTWRYTVDSQRDAVEAVAVLLRQQLIDVTKERLLGLIKQARQTNVALATMFQTDLFTATNVTFAEFRSQFGKQMCNGSDNYRWFSVFIDPETGKELKEGPTWVQMDVRLLPTYAALSEAPNLETYMSMIDISTVSLLSIETKVGEGSFKNPSPPYGYHGLVGTHIGLSDIGTFMSELNLRGGKMYVATRSGQLVAVSDGSKAFGQDLVKDTTWVISARDSEEPVIASAARHLERVYGSPQALADRSTQNKDVVIHSERYYIDSSPALTDHPGLVVVVIVPRVSFMGIVDKSSRRLGILLGCMAGGAVCVGAIMMIVLAKHTWDKMALKRELLEQLDRTKTVEAAKQSSRHFLANLSHDIRTPMSAVIGLAEIMRSNGLDPEQDLLLEQLQSSASMLNMTLTSILDITSIEAGKLDISTEPLDIRHELETIVDLFSVEHMNKGIDILLDIPDDIPPVLGDPLRFRQVFNNVISNCVKFTSEGYVLIRGETLPMSIEDEFESRAQTKILARKSGSDEKKKTAKDLKCGLMDMRKAITSFTTRAHPRIARPTSPKLLKLQFEIEDTGSEVPVAERETVFENFISAPDNSSRVGGTGVGLGIVRSLVGMMGGLIALVDKDHPGAMFRFTLIFAIDEVKRDSNHQLDRLGGREQDTTNPSKIEAPSVVRTLAPPLPGSRANHKLHVLVAMPASMHASLAGEWFRRRGHVVTQVFKMENISTAAGEMRARISAFEHWARISAFEHHHRVQEGEEEDQVAPSGLIIIDTAMLSVPQEEFFTKSSLQEFLLRLPQAEKPEEGVFPLCIAWATTSSMPTVLLREAKGVGCLIVQKPLLATRLTSLLRAMYQRQSSPPST